jgi:pilus assembly protein CpaF
LPEVATRRQIASAIDVVIQISRLSDGTRKVTSISEITGVEGEMISMQEIFAFRKTGLAENGAVLGEFAATGIRPRLSERLAASGVNLPPSMFESTRLH